VKSFSVCYNDLRYLCIPFLHENESEKGTKRSFRYNFPINKCVFGVKNAKFVALLQPNQHPQVSLAFSQIEATSTGYKAMLQVVSAQTVFAKMTLFLQPITA
jgi:hypothetical protein